MVASNESRAYGKRLGFFVEAVVQLLDVVDNTMVANTESVATKEERTPPKGWSHVLRVSRLLAKKSHIGLLHSYGQYQRQGGSRAPRPIGSAPLKEQSQESLANRSDSCRVALQPLQHQEILVSTDAEASAYLLASNGGGYSIERIEHGLSGAVVAHTPTASRA